MTTTAAYEWFQARGVGPTSKFHAAVWKQTGPGTNYKPFALCAAANLTEYRLDKNRPFEAEEGDVSTQMCRICRHRIRQQEEENTVVMLDRHYGDGDEQGPPLPRGNTAGSRLAAAAARAERHRREAERAEAELARLETLPPEPEVAEGEPNVIWFKKVFQNGSIPYDYAACKGSNGLWYTTGPQSPKGYPWQRLVEWIFEGESAEVWSASQMIRLGSFGTEYDLDETIEDSDDAEQY